MDTRWLELQGITTADLERNRKGLLADVQAERVRSENLLRKRAMIFGVGLGMVATAVVLAALQPTAAMPYILGIALALDVALVLVMRSLFRAFEQEVADGAVTVKEVTLGKLWAIPQRNRIVVRVDRQPYTGLHMGALGAELKEGDRVTLYVLPKSRAIVAVEPISA